MLQVQNIASSFARLAGLNIRSSFPVMDSTQTSIYQRSLIALRFIPIIKRNRGSDTNLLWPEMGITRFKHKWDKVDDQEYRDREEEIT